jgi:ATP-dependent helicase YprA (DUF1998 family)/very-short-patch-repair endonuclease
VDAFGVLGGVLDDYQRFVQGFLNIKDETVRDHVHREIAGGLLWPKPWLALNPAFEPGGRVGQLVDEDILSPACRDIFRHRTDVDPKGSELALHRHQRDAIEIAGRGESYVLTTGTGSGKSLSYIVPIVDRVLRDGSGKGVQAIIVYPMNALANSQKGELEKFLGRDQPKVTFRRYTGQESRKERDEILANPPDILLTNYVMLELMLVRPRERDELIRSAKDLKFLVLDELHTYRGRQGADVAMLIRRLRQAVAAPGLQCVGTSATLAGPGTRAEQRAEVAVLASRLFGTEIPAMNIVGESLRRATTGEYDPVRLADRVRRVAPRDFDDLAGDDLAIWIEEQFGLSTDDEDRLARRTPTRLADAAKVLAEQTGVGESECAAALEQTLLAGSEARDPAGRALFAFKLHQFIGKGDTAYVTLEPPGTRHLTTQYQRSNPDGPPGQPLFPLAFCRECGQEYLVVNREKRGGDTVFTPRLLTGGAGEPVDAQGLLLLTEGPWPTSGEELLDRLPDDWIVEDGFIRGLDKARKNRLPEPVRVDPFGMVTDDGLHAAFFETLHFCPECKTTYENSRQSEFTRVASLGTEGRASAVTVLSQAVVRKLKAATGLDPEARKFLAFSDNRQDASLQAGHFNDFVLVALVRSALYRAAAEHEAANPDEPLNADGLAGALVQALGLRIEDYAQNPDAEFGAEKKIKRALRESVAYRVFADLRRGWRITMPNLEQTGQLVMDYDSLDAIAAKDALWDSTDPALAGAGKAVRAQVMRVLLDEMRRHLCIESPYLTEERYTEIKDASQGWLKAPWALTDERGIYSATCYPGKRRVGATDRGDLYLSGLGGYGRWLRRPQRFPHWDHKIGVDDASHLIEQLLHVMQKAGLLYLVEEKNRPRGYRVESQMLLWRAGKGDQRAADPLRGTAGGGGRVNAYFRQLYEETANELAGLEAREHTAQVRSEDRRDREERFGAAELPVLYCSPTMELGVDIKSLNVVGLRNVPPTPANYAQRSGRAGRSGQPAVVLTYCATGNAHDNYYFSRSDEMVAGVVAPPRLELANQDLVRAHANAVWLVATGLDLKASMVELLDVEDEGQPLNADVKSKIASATAASTARGILQQIFGATSEVVGAPWWREDWIARTLADAPHAFERALDRWRGLYRDALSELDQASQVLKTIGADEASKRRARGQLSEARAALDLLKGEIDNVNQGDFYTYRYFASEGFLPGYSFPRLPLAAFIPAEKKTRNNGQGDYVQRPRFLAISEFGPGAFIYHEGARYEVNKVTLPARDDGTGVNLTEIKRCEECGYLHEGNGATGHEQCEQCGSPGLATVNRLMRLLAVKTRRRDRINADEEERQRAGYEIVTALRFEPHGERSSQQTSHLIDAAGQDLAVLTYGDTALIRRMNIGLRRRKNKSEVGYLLDTVDGKWARRPEDDKPGTADGDAHTAPEEAPAADSRVQRVVPYVEDHRNALLMDLPRWTTPEQRMAVMYALKRAIEAEFQLEDNELAAEPLPGRTGDQAWNVLLFFEAAEGGAGVLRRLATEHGRVRAVAVRALELLHFDPESGGDRRRSRHAAEDCAQACYDCLLTYGNQWEHQKLDRHQAKDLLVALRDAELVIGGSGGEDRDSQVERLSAQSNGLEKSLLRFLDEGGYRLPDQAQEIVDGLYVRPDFAYRRADVDAAVFIDGPHHDTGQQKERDEAARKKLARDGWLVLRFHHEDHRTDACGDPLSWQQVIDENPSVFGSGRAAT